MQHLVQWNLHINNSLYLSLSKNQDSLECEDLAGEEDRASFCLISGDPASGDNWQNMLMVRLGPWWPDVLQVWDWDGVGCGLGLVTGFLDRNPDQSTGSWVWVLSVLGQILSLKAHGPLRVQLAPFNRHQEGIWGAKQKKPSPPPPNFRTDPNCPH